MPGTLPNEVISELTQRSWTGNIREIEYVLRRLRLVAKDHNNVTLSDLDVADRMDDPIMDDSIIVDHCTILIGAGFLNGLRVLPQARKSLH